MHVICDYHLCLVTLCNLVFQLSSVSIKTQRAYSAYLACVPTIPLQSYLLTFHTLLRLTLFCISLTMTLFLTITDDTYVIEWGTL